MSPMSHLRFPILLTRVIAFRIAACFLTIGLAGGATATTHAGVPWHGDLAQAKAASVISHRPVLIVFTAKWSEASVSLDETTLANAEAIALITACFEPVKIDVDTDPETTRQMGVSYLPTACVVDLDDRVLATFDCPDTPASFIAAAGRAAQDAAGAKAQSNPSDGTVATVMAQARSQSDFTAEITTPPPTSPAATTVAAAPSAEAALPEAPPSTWPAEQASARRTFGSESAVEAMPAAASIAASQRPSIEPAPTAQPRSPADTASWLGGTTQQPTQNAPLAASETPGALPETGASPQVAANTPKSTNAFIAALQKPFTSLPSFSWPGSTKKPAAAATASTPPAADATDPNGTMPLGLEGYCPVTLIDRGEWVEGRAQWGARHRGRTYLFASAEQQRAFLADPDRYAPALSGDDPVMAFDSGKTIPGQRRYGVTYQSRIYLFSSPETRTAFSTDPQRYTARVALAENPQPATGTLMR